MKKLLYNMFINASMNVIKSVINIFKIEGVINGLSYYLCINLIITGFCTICISVISIFFWLVTGRGNELFDNWYRSLYDLLESQYIQYHLSIDGGTYIPIFKLHLIIICIITVYKTIEDIFNH